MQVLDYIPEDGYTELGYIAPRTCLHNAVRFKFRPIMVEQQNEWMRGQKDLKGDAWNHQAATMMSERIVEWDIIQQDGKTLPITPANIVRLKPALFVRLYEILLGTDPCDIDPKWPTDNKQSAASTQFTAASKGTNVGVAREEGDLKN